MITFETAVASGITLVAINILAWAFICGRILGSCNTRLTTLEKERDDPQLLPQCHTLFSNIETQIGNLNGKVDTLLLIVKEYQGNTERARITAKVKSQPRK